MAEKEMEYVLCNTNYMNWVIKKLNEKYYIDSHDENYDENDLAHASKLKTLYYIISEYAIHNDIKPVKSVKYDLYFVEYAGNLFFVYEGANSYGCFTSTFDKHDLPSYIKFEDVRREKLGEILDSDNSLFDGLRNEIAKLYNRGVSMELISQVFNRLACETHNEEKGHTYKKK